MSKYILADKLIAYVKFAKSVYSNPDRVIYGIADGFRQDGRAAMCDDILTKIASLQQEQPEETCKTCGFYENNCPFIRGKLIPYPNKVCKDYIYSAIKEQEQPEVDLEKAARNVYESWMGGTMGDVRRDMVELGKVLNARKEE